MTNYLGDIYLLGRVNSAHQKKAAFFIEYLGVRRFFQRRVLFMRAVTSHTITFKFFLKLFNHSFFIGDLIICNIPNISEFIEQFGDVFLEAPFFVYAMVVIGDGNNTPVSVSKFCNTMYDILKEIH